jgi:dihydrofolate reductase/thymidylate synthase
MPISLIACVASYKGRLAIGSKGQLLANLKGDLSYFRNITTVENAVVVMGYKTWCSIPIQNRPLEKRFNIVLTQSPQNHQHKIYAPNVVFMTFHQFEMYYAKQQCLDYFIIGGGEIYTLFLTSTHYKPTTIYLTHLENYKPDDENLPDIFLEHFDDTYSLVYASQQYEERDMLHRFLMYNNNSHPTNTSERAFMQLCEEVLQDGNSRPDRTNTGTISTFGKQVHYDISKGVPLFTTKRVPWKHAIEELLWFLRGDTDAKILQNRGVHIWDGNTSKEFLESRGLTYNEGILGPSYGWQWRHFGADYDESMARNTDKTLGFDQLEYIVNELKTNPYSRRILLSAWCPSHLDQMALPPCHYSVQFYVEHNKGGKPILSSHFVMRSNDLFLGHPFNAFSYAVLTYILAAKCDMQPGRLIYTGSDVHIYNNHVQQVETMLQRVPRPEPSLILSDDVKTKDWQDITVDDFNVIGYFPYPPIKADMAV